MDITCCYVMGTVACRPFLIMLIFFLIYFIPLFKLSLQFKNVLPNTEHSMEDVLRYVSIKDLEKEFVETTAAKHVGRPRRVDTDSQDLTNFFNKIKVGTEQYIPSKGKNLKSTEIAKQAFEKKVKDENQYTYARDLAIRNFKYYLNLEDIKMVDLLASKGERILGNFCF